MDRCGYENELEAIFKLNLDKESLTNLDLNRLKRFNEIVYKKLIKDEIDYEKRVLETIVFYKKSLLKTAMSLADKLKIQYLSLKDKINDEEKIINIFYLLLDQKYTSYFSYENSEFYTHFFIEDKYYRIFSEVKEKFGSINLGENIIEHLLGNSELKSSIYKLLDHCSVTNLPRAYAEFKKSEVHYYELKKYKEWLYERSSKEQLVKELNPKLKEDITEELKKKLVEGYDTDCREFLRARRYIINQLLSEDIEYQKLIKDEYFEVKKPREAKRLNLKFDPKELLDAELSAILQ